MKRIHLILLAILLCAGAQGQDLEPFKKGEKYGYKNAAGEVIIRAKYEYAATFTGDLARVELNKKNGFIDKTGKEVIPLKYDNASNFNEYGFAKIKLNNKWGFIDKTGKEVIPPIYDNVAYLSKENLIKVSFNRKFGYLDKTGKEIVPPKYDKVEHDHGLIRVMLNGKSGFINIVDGTEVEVVPLKYDYIGKWKTSKEDGEYRVEVWENGKYGEIDNSGKITVPFRYRSERMRMIWKNLLAPILGQINAYRSSLPNFLGSPDSSGSFTIERPYLLVSVYNFGKYEIDFERYSEKDFNEQVLSRVKTLVLRYDYETGTERYQNRNNNNINYVTNYGSYLIYFDVTKKEIVGYDYMRPPAFPVSIDLRTTGLRNKNSDIIEKIETHLTTSQ